MNILQQLNIFLWVFFSTLRSLDLVQNNSFVNLHEKTKIKFIKFQQNIMILSPINSFLLIILIRSTILKHRSCCQNNKNNQFHTF